ncbi:MAG: porin family protein [Bacteroidales bacterium]
MKKKTIFSLILIVMLSGIAHTGAQAQRRAFRHENLPQHDEKPYHFGFSLGLNKMGFALKPVENLHALEGQPLAGAPDPETMYTVLPGPQNGFHIGIVSNLKLTRQLDLRFVPTLSFGDRQIIYGISEDGQQRDLAQDIESTFLDFPIHFKYKSVRFFNTRAYVIGGAKYSHDLASAEDRDDAGQVILARIARNDVYLELGIGFDYYFQFFKFSTELKGSLGLTNLIRPENTVYTNSIDRLNSKIIMLSFLFE